MQKGQPTLGPMRRARHAQFLVNPHHHPHAPPVSVLLCGTVHVGGSRDGERPRGIQNIKSLNELTYENRQCDRTHRSHMDPSLDRSYPTTRRDGARYTADR